MQSIVYKLVPSLYAKEMQRREDFYRSTGVRASSSCSDDSVIDRERDMINDQEEMVRVEKINQGLNRNKRNGKNVIFAVKKYIFSHKII